VSFLSTAVQQVLEEGRFCAVATSTPRGPHCTPLVFAYAGGRIWLTTSRGSVKTRAWKVDPAVAGLVRAGDLAVAFTGTVKTYDALDLSGVVHRQDVRVAELRGHLHFTEEPVGAEGGGQLRPHHLHRHLAVVFLVMGQVDGGHPALAEHPLDLVAAGQRLLDLRHLDDAGGGRARRHPGVGGGGHAATEAELCLFWQRCLAGRTGAGSGGHRCSEAGKRQYV
jgi:hypothetical protein